MQRYGFKWEAVPTKTKDGFTLTLFRLTGTDAHGCYGGV